MELETRRIWDYSEDSYAHRLPGSGGGLGGSLGTKLKAKDKGSISAEKWNGGLAAGPATGPGFSFTALAAGLGAEDLVEVKLHELAAEYEALLVAQLGERRDAWEEALARERAALGRALGASACATFESSWAPEEKAEADGLRAALAALEGEHAAVLTGLRRDEAALREARLTQAALLEVTRLFRERRILHT